MRALFALPRASLKETASVETCMPPSVCMLLVEGEASHAERIIEIFRSVESVSLHYAKNIKEARAFLAVAQPHIILADWILPDGRGIELLADAEHDMRLPVVLMTSSGSEDLAVEAIKSGALDYFVKSPERVQELPQVISRALREWESLAGRRQAEEALRQSEQRMRLHIEQTPLAVIEWDTDFRVLQWNPAAVTIFGYTAGEALGQHACFIIPKTSRELVDRAWQDLLAQKGGHRSTNENIRKDGSIICCEWYNTPLTNAEGVVVGVASLAQDISERVRAQEELRESRNFLVEIQRLVHVAGWKYDFRKSAISWSDELYRLLGYAPGAVEPSFERYFSHVHPDDKERVASLYKIEDALSLDMEYRLVSVDAAVHYIITRTSYEYDDEGSSVCMCGAIADITGRKLAENAVKTSRDMLEKIFQTCPDTIIFSDAVGDIVAVNDAVEKALGYTPQEVIGESFTLLAPDQSEGMQVLRKVLGDFFEKGFLKDREIIFRNKSGTNIYLECNVSALRDDTGAITGAVSVLRDITERKKMEAQYRQSQKMEAIGTLAGGIAHDFNNILAAIMGYTELSLEDADRGISVQHNLDQILKSAMRARDLVRQILAFSRKDMEARAPLQVSTLIKEALKLLRATLPATIDIREAISSQSALVNANPTQIHQVLMNLCTNAAHAMSENGGVLEIGLSSVFLAERQEADAHDLPEGAYVKVTVSDTGTGIDPRYIEHIFEPFFTTKEFGKGTGMGLAVVHGIVKSCGGDIRVRSQPGSGATFDVLLPELQDAIMEAPPEPPPLLTGTERILLVDDEKMLLDVGQSMLKSLGYTPIVMLSSTSALEWFQKDPDGFDLVITDMTMPHMTGDRLAQKLMRIRPGIPIIIATGYNEKISEETVRELGIKALVMKPFNRREMSQTIRSVLDSSKEPAT